MKYNFVISIIEKDRNTRDHQVWTIGNGDQMHELRIRQRIPRAREQQG